MSFVDNDVELLTACPVCGGNHLRRVNLPAIRIGDDVFRRDLGTNAPGLVDCRQCGLEFVNPRPSRDLIAAFYNRPGYPAHYSEPSDSHKEVMKIRLGLLSSMCRVGNLLDYGCGGRGFMKLAEQAGWRVAGIEPSEVGRANASEQGFEVEASIEKLSHKNGTFDVVTMFHVLEHVPDLTDVLAGIRRLLKPGGMLLVEVPNLGSLRARLMVLGRCKHTDDERYRAFPIHLYGFTRATLTKLMIRSGYEIAKTTSYGVGIARPANGDAAGKGEVSHAGASQTRRGPVSRGINMLLKRAIAGLHLGENLVAFGRVPDGDRRA